MATSRHVHEYVIPRDRGRASEHTCACGAQATEWAYQHQAAVELRDENGSPYSLDPEDYAPMCRTCHIKLDGNPVLKRMQADPEFDARMRETGSKNGVRTSAIRRPCSCGRSMSPGALATHQRFSGHKELING